MLIHPIDWKFRPAATPGLSSSSIESAVRRPARTLHRSCRSGFTLVEMLVAVAVTLLIMGAVVTLFANVNEGISQSIGSLDVQDRLRTARTILLSDVNNMTVNPAVPPLSVRTGQGYLEIAELSGKDTGITWIGDYDDVLSFTTYGRDFPSSGLEKLESSPGVNYPPGAPTAAEVIWFVHEGILYRRVLPILPGHPAEADVATLSEEEFYGEITEGENAQQTKFVVSRRGDGSDALPGEFNSLDDLELRKNRHGRGSNTPLSGAVIGRIRSYLRKEDPDDAVNNPPVFDHLSDIAVLDNVVGFDVRVWDPGAPLYEVATVGEDGTSTGRTVVLEPGDKGWPGTGTPVGYGAFVDLNYTYSYTPTSGSPVPHFNSATGSAIYDTWSRQNDAGTSAANGLDSDGVDGVDDAGERGNFDSSPWPLRAIEIRIRVYEASSKTVREVTVRRGFTK